MDSSQQKPRSLIMCVTPLQMLIAEKIIELNLDKKFDLLVLALNDNDKYTHYYNRLSKFCLNSLYYVAKPGIKGFFDFKEKLKENKLNIMYQELYFASIDSRHFQYIFSKNFISNVYTFDDGTANIIPSSIYYAETKIPVLKKYMWRILGVKYYMEDIKKKSKLHYTLYDNMPNIIDKKQIISLFPLVVSNLKDSNKVIKFYLGQPLIDISEYFDVNFVENKIKNININYYYPHPREINYPKGNYEIIKNPLIFEDFIVNFLLENPDVQVEIYSFISTALLNVANLKQVKAIYIHDTRLYQLHHNFYDFAEKAFNIPHLNLD